MLAEVEGRGISVVAHKIVRAQVDESGRMDDLGAFDGRKGAIDAFAELVALALVELVEDCDLESEPGLELEFGLELDLDENDDYTEVAVAVVEKIP